MEKYDAIVIGAGNGGLSAACALAHGGKKTLLVEQHNLAGGCAVSFRRGRFEFEGTVHEVCGVGSEDNPGDVRKILEGEYGLGVKWLKIPDCFRVITTGTHGEKIDATMPCGRKEFIAKMESYVPGSTEPLNKFFELVDEVNAGVDYITNSGGKPDTKLMQKKYPNFLRTAGYPTIKVLKALKIPQLAIDIMGTYWPYIGTDLENSNFQHYAAMIDLYVTYCGYIPEKTSHNLEVGLLERFKAMGGTALFNTKALSFILDEKKHIVGVKTTQGDFATRHVVFDGAPNIAYSKMMKQEDAPERSVKLINARKKIGGSFFVVFLGLNKSIEELGIKDYCIFMDETADTHKEYLSMQNIDTNKWFIAMCYNVISPEMSPKGTTLFGFCKEYTAEAWKDVKPEDYFKMKEKVTNQMIDEYEEKVGIKIRPYIEEIEAATPVTYARYTGAPFGSVYGYEADNWDSILMRMSQMGADYGKQGLRFCGSWGPRGDGYSGTFIDGNLMGKLTLDDMDKEDK